VAGFEKVVKGRRYGRTYSGACASPAMLIRWCRLGVPVHVLGAFDCGRCDGWPTDVTAPPAKGFVRLVMRSWEEHVPFWSRFVGASSTPQQCLATYAPRLDRAFRRDYTSRLPGLWKVDSVV